MDMLQIDYSSKFLKQYAKVSDKIQTAVKERMALFEEDFYHPLLRNHELEGKYAGYRSINITGDWRALYRISDNKILFDLLGTHSELYG